MDNDIIIHGSRPMLGTSDFAKLRAVDGLYVDKTAFIREVVERGSETLAYLRPRRFGKSLALSMLKCFLDCRDPRPELFAGLEIAHDRAFWERHFGKYPVILLSLKNLDCDTFPEMLEKLADALQSMAEGFDYLLESRRLRASQKRFLEHLMDGNPTRREMEKSLSMLSRMLCAHHGQRCVILLDEYDVPLNHAHLKDYYSQAIEVIRPLMGMALKDNEALRFGVVTGCLRIAKESIFTGLNHLDVHTVLTPEDREWFGFSSEEVQAALAARGAAGCYTAVQRWYDGYQFGRHEVYNPWSIMNFLASVTPEEPDGQLTTYWANTSGNDILTRLLERAERRRTLAAAVEGLFDDVPVVCRVSETVTYADMLDRDDTLWSVMLFSGYLKPADIYQYGSDSRLLLPNREVRELLRDTVRAWLAHPAQPGRGGRLLEALIAGRVQEAQDLLTALLRATISYNDYSEDFYHAFLAGLLASVDSAQVLSNREAGDGRMDIGVLAGDGQTALVLELKVAPSFDRLGERAREGLDQIDSRRYDSAFSDLDGVVIRRYGVAFCRKACAVALADEMLPQHSTADGVAPCP